MVVKKTEIGVIPNDWIVSTLLACLVGKPSYGINAPAIEYSPQLPRYIRITDITESGAYSNNKSVSVEAKNIDRYYLAENDIVLARTGASVGKSYLYQKKDGNLVYAGFLIKASVNANVADARYIFACLHTQRYWQWVKTVSVRSGQPGINGEEYSMYLLPLPPRFEQTAIAEALSDVDSLISALKKLIAKKKAIKKGAMQELLTGKKRLPGFSGKWKIELLPKLLQGQNGIKIGPFGSQLKKEYLVNTGEFKIYGQENVYEKNFRLGNRYLTKERYLMLKSCELLPGDFVISSMGTVGKCAIIPSNIQKGIMDSHLIRLRFNCKKIESRYILQLFSDKFDFLQSQISKLSVGGIMEGLSTKIVQSVNVFYPVDVSEQKAICTILNNMDSEIEQLEKKLAKYQQIKEGMIQELLTGRIRLCREVNDG